MPEYVWVRDNGSGHQGPLPKEEAASLGEAVTVDPKHPTHDTAGDLLHWVTKSSVSSEAAKQAGQSAATQKES